MRTFLFDEVVFGPIRSRRLGISLGINTLHPKQKSCNFDCIYCECGWNPQQPEFKYRFSSVEEIERELRLKQQELYDSNETLDCITFAGNGEPTLHPQFDQVVQAVELFRNRAFPDAKIVLLSNATLLDKRQVKNVLGVFDQLILKLDAGSDELLKRINKPRGHFNLKKLRTQLKSVEHPFTVQALFFQGSFQGKAIDNTSEQAIGNWMKQLKEVKPEAVMLYTLDRDTPASGLRKVSSAVLRAIGKRVESLGIKTIVA